jgi:hypothetical protein
MVAGVLQLTIKETQGNEDMHRYPIISAVIVADKST